MQYLGNIISDFNHKCSFLLPYTVPSENFGFWKLNGEARRKANRIADKNEKSTNSSKF